MSEIDEKTIRSSASMLRWIKNNRVTDSREPYTHGSLDPKSKFYISKTDTKMFMVDYIQDVMIGGNRACIAEYIGKTEPRPVIADIDMVGDVSKEFELKGKRNNHMYGQSTIKRIVKCWQNAIRTVIQNPSSVNLLCVVLEKPSYRNEGDRIKDGFHLFFPFCVTEPWVQTGPMYDAAIKEIDECAVLKETRVKRWLSAEYSNDITKVIDNVAKNSNVLMYGSRKSLTDEYTYEATQCFDERCEHIELVELLNRDPRYRNAFIEIDSDSESSDYSEDSEDSNDSDGYETMSDSEYSTAGQDRDPVLINLVNNPRTYQGSIHHILPVILSVLGKAVNAMPLPQVRNTYTSCIAKASKKMHIEQPDRSAVEESVGNNAVSDKSSTRISALVPGEYIHINGEEPIYMPRSDEAPDEALRQAAMLMLLLNPARADSYNDWIRVGLNLHGIGKGHKYAYMLWLAFSTQSGKFDRRVCANKWRTFEVQDGFTIRTLYAWARLDNPQGLREMQKAGLSTVVNELLLSSSHFDCARLLHKIYGDQFVCASIKHKIWYHYKDNKWKLSENGYTLQLAIARHLSMALFDASESSAADSRQLSGTVSDFEFINRVAGSAARNEAIAKIQKNLRNDSFQSAVMRQAQLIFYGEGFVGKLDQNPWLLGYDNGILDLKRNEFVQGTPDHYVSMTTGCSFSMDYTWDHPDVVTILDIYNKIYVDESLNKAWWRLAASCLYGGNPDKIVPFLTGRGNNAKSTVIDHLDIIFGDYFCVVPVEFMTAKAKDSGNAHPEIWRTQGRRVVAILETGDDAKINEGIMKRISGNDKMFARTLYAEGADIKPMFKVFVVANRLPMIPSSLPATWSRVFVIPHASKFDTGAPPDKDAQEKQMHFPIDPEITQKLKQTKSAMHWILFQKWKEYKDGGLLRPTVIQDAIERYRLRNDVYGQFISESIVVDPAGIITLADAYTRFKDWYMEGFPRMRIPQRQHFEDYMTQKWGSSRGKKWIGYRWRTMEDEEDRPDDRERETELLVKILSGH